MSEDCFAVFMDESGLGSKRKGKANYWVSVGVMAGINDHYSITQDIHDLKKKSMRLYNKEMKGTDLSANHLNAGITKETVAKDLAEIIKNHGLRIVVTATNMSPKLESLTIFTPSNEKRGLQAAEILFVDVPYSRCKIIGCVCGEDSDCRHCCIPIVMQDEARRILRQEGY